MTSHDVPQEDIREYVESFEEENGHPYVKSKHVAEEFGISRKQAGKAIAKLEDGGLVERWSDSHNATWVVQDA